MFRQLGDRAGVAWSLRHQGDIAREQHDHALAESLYLQSLESFNGLGDSWSAGSLLTDLGNLALSSGEIGKGLDRFRAGAGRLSAAGRAQAGTRAGDRRPCARGLARGRRTARRATGRRGRLAPQRHRHAVDADGTAAGWRPISNRRHAGLSAGERSEAWVEGWAMTGRAGARARDQRRGQTRVGLVGRRRIHQRADGRDPVGGKPGAARVFAHWSLSSGAR